MLTLSKLHNTNATNKENTIAHLFLFVPSLKSNNSDSGTPDVSSALAPPPALTMTCLLLLLTSNALDEASFSCFNKEEEEEEGEEKEETTTSALEEYPPLNFDVALFLLSCCLFLKVNLF